MPMTELNRQEGFSLVELLVAMLLVGIVGSVVVSGILAAFRSATSTGTRVEATQELELAMQQITRDLRSTRSLRLLDDCGTALQTEVRRGGGDPFVIEYAFDPVGQAVVSRRLDFVDGGPDTEVSSARSIVTQVDDDGEPLFTYLNADGNDIYEDGDCSIEEGASRTASRRVQIRLSRQAVEGPVVVESTVGVRINRYVGGTS